MLFSFSNNRVCPRLDIMESHRPGMCRNVTEGNIYIFLFFPDDMYIRSHGIRFTPVAVNPPRKGDEKEGQDREMIEQEVDGGQRWGE
jgi:hypothetical protein